MLINNRKQLHIFNILLGKTLALVITTIISIIISIQKWGGGVFYTSFIESATYVVWRHTKFIVDTILAGFLD